MNSDDWNHVNPDLKAHLMAELHLEFERLSLNKDNSNFVIPEALFNVLKTSILNPLEDSIIRLLADIMFNGYAYWLEFLEEKKLTPFFYEGLNPFANIHKVFSIKKLNATPLKNNPVKHSKRKFDVHILETIQKMNTPGKLGIFDYFSTSDGKGSFGLFAKLPKRTRNNINAIKKIPPYRELDHNKEHLPNDHTGRIGYYIITYALNEYFKRGAPKFNGLKIMPFNGIALQSELVDTSKLNNEVSNNDT
ncbi:hypothetical protein CANINC_003044 [Pichia inconspicua]|uniref:Uncharacterized protein n=1 Tax=Pichia inconspicua TaxID=52247 RepID=A0A4V4NFK0_9ASCO|nr:hypothetical protein CANINC_003044 [[Candida] inconspicua]